jgi:hypothetical protein
MLRADHVSDLLADHHTGCSSVARNDVGHDRSISDTESRHTLDLVLRGCCKSVTRVKQECNKGVTSMLQGYYKHVACERRERHKNVTRVLHGCSYGREVVVSTLANSSVTSPMRHVEVGWYTVMA